MPFLNTLRRLRGFQTSGDSIVALIDANDDSVADHDFEIFANDVTVAANRLLRVRQPVGTSDVEVVSTAATKSLGTATDPWTSVTQENAILQGSTSGALTLTVPAIVTPHTLTLPGAVGAPNTMLSDVAGSGTLSWLTLAGVGGVTGTGIAGRVTFWNGMSTLTSDAGFTYASGTDSIALAGFENIGTTTDAASAGSWAAGLTGVARIHWDQAAIILRIRNASNQAIHDLATASGGARYIMRTDVGGSGIDFNAQTRVVTIGFAGTGTLYAGSTRALRLGANATAFWEIPTTGSLVPLAVVNIGTGGSPVNEVFTNFMRPGTSTALTLRHHGGTSVFTIDANGGVILAAHNTAGAGESLAMSASNAITAGLGGSVTIDAGNAIGAVPAAGGSITLTPGLGAAGGAAGDTLVNTAAGASALLVSGANGSVTINDAGGSAAVFRVETANVTDAFEVDASAERVRLGAQTVIDGTITPATLSATENDFAPTDLDRSTVMRLTPAGGGSSLTGLTGGIDGRIIILQNIDTTDGITLIHESGSSSAANRFTLGGGVNRGIANRQAAIIQYDGTVSRWRLIGFG